MYCRKSCTKFRLGKSGSSHYRFLGTIVMCLFACLLALGNRSATTAYHKYMISYTREIHLLQ